MGLPRRRGSGGRAQGRGVHFWRPRYEFRQDRARIRSAPAHATFSGRAEREARASVLSLEFMERLEIPSPLATRIARGTVLSRPRRVPLKPGGRGSSPPATMRFRHRRLVAKSAERFRHQEPGGTASAALPTRARRRRRRLDDSARCQRRRAVDGKFGEVYAVPPRRGRLRPGTKARKSRRLIDDTRDFVRKSPATGIGTPRFLPGSLVRCSRRARDVGGRPRERRRSLSLEEPAGDTKKKRSARCSAARRGRPSLCQAGARAYRKLARHRAAPAGRADRADRGRGVCLS